MRSVECNGRIASIVALAVVLASLAHAAPAATSAAAMDAYIERQVSCDIATLTVITALSGEQLAGMGAGYVLPMELLDKDRQVRILDAVKKAMSVSVADHYLEGIPPDGRRVLWLFPRFSATFQAPGLGGSGETIQLLETNLALSSRCIYYVGSYPGDWRPQTSVMVGRDIWLAAATPDTFSKALDYKPPALRPLKDPPRIEEILSHAPNESKAKLEYLRKQAFDLVAPIGEMWLARDPSLPFTYSDFADGKTFDIGAASATQKEWLRKLYAEHHFRAGSRQPAWEDLGNATVKLKVEYSSTIDVVRLVTDQETVLRVLGRPDSFSPREQMEWGLGKTPLRFAENQAPPVYKNVSGKGMGWLLTR